jgi:hypothetical protein
MSGVIGHKLSAHIHSNTTINKVINLRSQHFHDDEVSKLTLWHYLHGYSGWDLNSVAWANSLLCHRICWDIHLGIALHLAVGNKIRV